MPTRTCVARAWNKLFTCATACPRAAGCAARAAPSRWCCCCAAPVRTRPPRKTASSPSCPPLRGVRGGLLPCAAVQAAAGLRLPLRALRARGALPGGGPHRGLPLQHLLGRRINNPINNPVKVAALVPEGGPHNATREISNMAYVSTARMYGSSVQTPADRRVSPGESRQVSNNSPEEDQRGARKASRGVAARSITKA